MSRSAKTIALFIAVFIFLTSILSSCAISNVQPKPHGQNGGADEQPNGAEELNDDSSGQESQYEDGLGEDGKIHVYLIGNGEKVSTPQSSFIDYIVYYKESEHLIVCINNKKNENDNGNENGKEYVYANIKESLWENFKNAESKGKLYNAEIKGKHEFFIKDYDGNNGDLIIMHHVDD